MANFDPSKALFYTALETATGFTPETTYVYFTMSASTVDPEACTTQLFWQLRLNTEDNDLDRVHWWDFYIDGQHVSGSREVEFGKNIDMAIAAGTVTVTHPSDGSSKTVAITGSYGAEKTFWKYGFETTLTEPKYFTAPGFSRQATISFVNAFNDEENISIGYYNPAKSAATVEACISMDNGATDTIKYRECNALSSMYTFELTEAERNILRAANTTGTKATALFFIRTTIDGNVWHSSMSKEYEIINTTPTLSPTVRDTDTYITSLTGNDQKFILGYSDLYFDSGANAKKQASIDYQWIRCGSVTLEDYTSNTGTINDIDSGTVYFEMKDSRGQIVRDARVLSVIPYTKLTASVETGPFNANGTVTFTLKGLYFDDTFGNEHNSMQVQYSLRDEDGNFAQVDNVRESGWVELGQVQPTTSSGTYEFSHTITGLDYEKTWELTVAVQDALTPLQTVTTVVAPLPVFDWSGKDFHHHTDVILSEGMSIYLGNVEISGDNKILWSGASHMNGSQTVYLTSVADGGPGLISEQPNGIVLVFSLYRDGVAADASFNTFFVSKKEVELFSGNAHTYLLGINSGFSKIGAKYLSIYDDHLTGNDTNTATGTNSGITFDNASFVLRAVIGV